MASLEKPLATPPPPPPPPPRHGFLFKRIVAAPNRIIRLIPLFALSSVSADPEPAKREACRGGSTGDASRSARSVAVNVNVN